MIMAVDQDTIHQQVVYYLTLVLGGPGIILNILTVIVLFKVKYHQIGPHLILLRSLVFADLLVCVVAVVKTTSKPHLYLDGSWSTCLFDAIFEQCSFAYTATFLTLILIAVNQYIAITEALRYHQLVTGRRLRAAVALVWIPSLLIHCIDLFRALIISQLSDEDDESFCYILEQFKNWKKIAIPWKVFVALVGVGFISLSVIYIKIFIVARSSLKQSVAFSPDVNQQRKTKRNSLYTSLLLLGTFLLVYVPYCSVYATQEVYQAKLSAKIQLFEETVADYEKHRADIIVPWDQRLDVVKWTNKWMDELNELKQSQSEALEKMEAVKEQLRLVNSYMEPILLLNAICDPLIYMIKITTIRKVYKQMMCHFCKKTSPGIH